MEKQISEELPRLFEALNISDKQAQEALTRKAAAVSCGKGEQLPQRSNGEGLLYVLLRGCVCREMDTPDGRCILENILYRFGSVINPVMFTQEGENRRCICLQDSEFVAFPIEELRKLRENVTLLQLYSHLLREALDEQSRHKYMLSLRSEEKYQWFTEHYGDIAEQIPMKVVAQFLNIDPATLSRIRKKRNQKQRRAAE